jgi:hypothetical protein
VKTLEDYVRPSGLTRLAACAGSAQLEAYCVNLFGEPELAPEATLGTKMHSEVALALQLWLSGASWEDAIANARINAEAAGLSGWDTIALVRCIEFAADLINEHEISKSNVLVEQQLDLSQFGFTKPGTADLVLVVPFKCVIVVDWKLGFLDQGDADTHDQLQAYACGAASIYKADTVLVYLVQTRQEKKRRASGGRFDGVALRAAESWNRMVTDRARSEVAELAAGIHCLNCKALAHCEEARRYIDMHIKQAKMLVDGEFTTLDPDQRGARGSAAKVADKWAKAILDLVKKDMIAGQLATGFKLGEPRATRSITNAAQAMVILNLHSKELAKQGEAALSMSPAKLSTAAELVLDEAGLIESKLSSPPLNVCK